MFTRARLAAAVFLLLLCSIGNAIPRAAYADSQRAPAPVVPGGAQAASNSLQGLDYSFQPGGRIVLRLVFRNELTQPPPVIVSYHPVSNIAVDFHDTRSALVRDRVEVRQGGLRDIVVVQAGTRTRLIIHLARPLLHETVLKGKELWITLRRPEPRASDVPFARSYDAARDAPRHGVLRVGFERGASNSGRIVVELADAATPVEIRREGTALIVDFHDAAAAPSLERRLDVRDFGTSVLAVETYRMERSVRVKIELAGTADYSAYQVSRQLVVLPR